MWDVRLRGLLSILSSALDVAARHQKILYYHSFLFTLPAHEIFKIVPFGGLIVIDVVLLAAPAASAGNHLSVGLENLFNLNRISHNWEQYNTATEKRKHKNHFFYFFFGTGWHGPCYCQKS